MGDRNTWVTCGVPAVVNISDPRPKATRMSELAQASALREDLHAPPRLAFEHDQQTIKQLPTSWEEVNLLSGLPKRVSAKDAVHIDEGEGHPVRLALM